MKKSVIIAVITVILLWIGFITTSNHSLIGENQQVNEVMNTEPELKKISLQKSKKKLYFLDNDYKMAAYEPVDSCYLGAYVLSNNSLNYSIEEFERKTGRRHGIYVYNLILGNEFPTNWILECIANMKTPLIVIHPKDGMILNESFLYDVAKNCNQLSVPIFVDFYPNPEKYPIFPDEYKEFYSKARKVFNKYSPNSAFVWSVNLNNVYNSKIYYPGSEVTDWVGLSIYEPIYKNNEKLDTNIWEAFDFFYNQYQKNNPIMITQFGASHYSDVDHSYYINDAKLNIKEFYNKIETDYPRVKCINYMDFKDGENYKVTDNEEISDTYKLATDSEHFTFNLNLDQNKSTEEYIKSAFDISEAENQYYISDRCLKYELNLDVDKVSDIYFENMYWYPLEIIKEYRSCNIKVDDNKLKLHIYE